MIVIVFAISLVAVGGFAAGGQSYLAGLYRRQAEMGYRRALTEFATHIRALSSELNRARVARGIEQRGLIGSTVRRLVYAAQGNLGELPLGTVQLERVERLLGHIAAETYAYQDGEERLPGGFTNRSNMSATSCRHCCAKKNERTGVGRPGGVSPYLGRLGRD